MDQYGVRADIIVDPNSMPSRMNPSQMWHQGFCRIMMHVEWKMKDILKQGNNSPEAYEQAYGLMIHFFDEVHPNYAKLVSDLHTSPEARRGLVDEAVTNGMFLQINLFQKGITPELLLKLKEEYHVEKTPVTWKFVDPDGNLRTETSRVPILIAPEYWHCLYKIPHQSCAGMGYVNQYHTPVRANALAKMQFPISQTAIRIGEDEFRNLEMCAGEEVPLRLIGMYANSPEAVRMLGRHLIYNEHPSQLEKLPMTTEEIVKDNAIVGVAKHIFSTCGIDINSDITKIPHFNDDLDIVVSDENKEEQ